MANSKVTITFNMWLDAGEFISWKVGYTDIIKNPVMLETWYDFRTNSNQVAKGDPLEQLIQDTRDFFIQAFNLDYNSSGAYTVTPINNNVVEIEVNTAGLQFFAVTNSHPSIVINVQNVPLEDFFAIDSVTYSAGASCDQVNVTVQANEVIASLTANGTTITTNGTNTISFDWPKADLSSYLLTLVAQNATADQDSETVTLPLEVRANQIGTQVTNSPSGANVRVTHIETAANQLQYSLDNTNWQTSQYFNGIAAGSYNAYVRDQWGCSASTPFTVDTFTGNINELIPEFSISNINAIRFKKNEVWDYDTIYKNDENTLSFEEEYEAAFCAYRQKFQTSDAATTQLRSNYATITATVHDGTGETPLTVIKKSDNIQRKDMRDGNVYAIDSNYIGVYFIDGDTYDYDTQVPNGTYVLNGELPSWAQIDLWVFINTIGWLQISDIVRNDEDTAWVLKFAYANANPAPFTERISTIYDARNFEDYEFDIDFNGYLGKTLQIKVTATDPTYGTKEALSEIIEVRERWTGTVALKYSHSKNTGTMNYSYGIEHLIRVTGRLQGYNPDGEKDIHRTDSATVPILAKVYQDFEIDVHAEPTAMAHKVALALCHDQLEINGIGYVAKEIPETEQLGEQSNLYSINGKVTKAGSVFTDDTSPAIGSGELIGLLEDNGDYFKIT